MKISIACAFVLSCLAAPAALAQKKEDKPIEIKAKVIEELTSEYFGYFDFEIINNTDEWIVLRNLEIVFPEAVQNANVRAVSGPDFDLWQSVMQKRLAKAELGKNTSLAVIGALGYGLAAFSGNRALQNVGAAAAAGAGGAYIGSEYSKLRDSVHQTKRYPENHLLGDSIVVLPGLSEGRWLLLNSRSHDSTKLVSSFLVNYTMNDGVRHGSRIEVGKTAWQKKLWWRPNYDQGGMGSYR